VIRSRPSLAARRSRTGRAGRTPSGDARVNAPTRYARPLTSAALRRCMNLEPHSARSNYRCRIGVCRRRDLLAPTAADVCGDPAGSAWRRCGCSRRCVAPHDGHAPAGVPTSRRRRGGNVMVPLPAPAPRREEAPPESTARAACSAIRRRRWQGFNIRGRQPRCAHDSANAADRSAPLAAEIGVVWRRSVRAHGWKDNHIRIRERRRATATRATSLPQPQLVSKSQSPLTNGAS